MCGIGRAGSVVVGGNAPGYKNNNKKKERERRKKPYNRKLWFLIEEQGGVWFD